MELLMSITKKIKLETPIQSGDNEISEIVLRKPAAGDLRGIGISSLLQLDVIAIGRVLPRISSPTLTEAEISKMDIVDFAQIGGEIAAFLLTKAERAAYLSE